MGTDYERGECVAQNLGEARRCFKKVADNDDAQKKHQGFAAWRYGVLAFNAGYIEEGKKYIRKAQSLENSLALKSGAKYLKA